MNVQPKPDPAHPGKQMTCPAGASPGPARREPAAVRLRRVPTSPRLVSTWEQPWPLELEVEPWRP